MSKIETSRRPLSFATLDEVMREVDRLIDGGHKTSGTWSLAQICNHLSRSLIGSVESAGASSAWSRPLRRVFGPIVWRRIRRNGQLPEGVSAPDAVVPRPADELDLRAEVEALRGAIWAYAAHQGPIAEHPYFGKLDRADLDRFHCIHCAHHLSFTHPVEANELP
jgi:hypothetical protein